jgi:hypothetical protein
MDNLPNIREKYLEVFECFEPIAKNIYPEMENGELIGKTMALARDWLDREASKAIDFYYEKKGIKIYG